MSIQNKVKFFIWRLFHDVLPVARNLRIRGIDMERHCKICGYKVEPAEHIFVKCWWAISFWARMGLSSFLDSYKFDNIREWLWYCFKSSSPDTFVLICYEASMIWRNQNLVSERA